MIPCPYCSIPAVSEHQLRIHVSLTHKGGSVDPYLMTDEEIGRRSRVVIEPCLVCSHNRQAHVLEGMFLFEAHGQRLQREITDACVACTCLEFVELVDDEQILERTAGSALIPESVVQEMSRDGEPK